MTRQLDLEYVGVTEMCALVGRSRQWWARHHDELLQRYAFPLPMPGPGRPVWRREDIIAWRDRRPVIDTPARERPEAVVADVLARAGLTATT